MAAQRISPTSRSLPGTIHRVVLAGFMGCGKTTVGKLLARRLGWHFADLDDAVSAELGLAVPEIFAQRGEAAFRAAEVATLQVLLTSQDLVVALGGGAPETPALRDALVHAPATLIVHLDAAFDVLFARCTQQAKQPGAVARPLLGSRSDAEARYLRRRPIYAGIAHLLVDTGIASPDDVAATVQQVLASGFLP